MSAVINQATEEQDTRAALRFVTCGSVDDGKSTLIGRLLYDSDSVSLDVLAAQTRTTTALETDALRAIKAVLDPKNILSPGAA